MPAQVAIPLNFNFNIPTIIANKETEGWIGFRNVSERSLNNVSLEIVFPEEISVIQASIGKVVNNKILLSPEIMPKLKTLGNERGGLVKLKLKANIEKLHPGHNKISVYIIVRTDNEEITYEKELLILIPKIDIQVKIDPQLRIFKSGAAYFNVRVNAPFPVKIKQIKIYHDSIEVLDIGDKDKVKLVIYVSRYVYKIELPFSKKEIIIIQKINKKIESIVSLKIFDEIIKMIRTLHEKGEDLRKIDAIEIKYDNKIKSKNNKKVEDVTIFWNYEYKVPVELYLKIDNEYISLNRMKVLQRLIEIAMKNLNARDLLSMLNQD